MGEDWIFLAMLGFIMAVLSYVMDKGISMCTNARVWLYRDLTSDPVMQFIAWISLPVCLILFSAGFVHLVAPQSIGKNDTKHALTTRQLIHFPLFFSRLRHS